jgi:flavin reductase (DIM6/NTAB) family NADH-FMN oxidoreductase RutF
MINFESLFKISYGLYIVSSGNEKKGNGYISNTVFQITSEPAQFAACCNKNNYTAELIKNTGAFSVSVLQKEASSEIIGRFGYKSGKDMDKMSGMLVKTGITGTPILLNDCIAYLECNVIHTFDVGTHLLFIGKLVAAETIDNTKDPLTYQYYREVKKGVAPKNAPTYIDKSKLESVVSDSALHNYKCSVCGYIYDEASEEYKFSDLPDTYICPICGATKEYFTEL